MTDSRVSPLTRARASLLAVTTIASTSPAWAYVDPGTGSMLVQMAIAGLAGALFYFRQLRLAALDWFRRTILRQDSAQNAVAPEATDADSGR